MQIGDKVRFLSETGGGVIAGFQGKNIVLVEDADGFQMPVTKDEVVVIEGVRKDGENGANGINGTNGVNGVNGINGANGINGINGVNGINRPYKTYETYETHETQQSQQPQQPQPHKPSLPPQERPDGERLNVFLSFVPVNVKELSKTTFECYLVNDCNYYIDYTYASIENAAWTLRSQGTIEPNTKLFIEEFGHAMLNDIERVGVQLIAYKLDKPFAPKQPVSIDLRIDTTKFYKLHTFRESLFFDEPTLEYDIVRDDQPSRPLVISAQELKRAMQEKEPHPERQPARAAKKLDRNEMIEIDLHAHEVLETTAGMSAGDIKEYQLKMFRDTMDAHLKEKGRRIVFIHGKGEGVLRQALISELKHRYKSCTYQDASFQQYGFGATMVIIH